MSGQIKDKTVYSLNVWRRIILWPLAMILRLWGASLRFKFSEETKVAFGDISNTPTVFLLWHNRLFLAIEFFRRFRAGTEVYSLISASKDGAWLTAFFSLVGMKAIRGSSSRKGHDAVRELLGVLDQGHHIGITPDGPRGPLYQFKPGAYIIAKRARTRIVLFGAKFSRFFRVSSWDRLFIPLPFSKIEFIAQEISKEQIHSSAINPETLGKMLTAINPD